MKWMTILLPLIAAACGHNGNSEIDVYSEPIDKPTVYQDHEIYKIDSALKQLGYEYNKANQAISVNDAEKVYLQRFAEELQSQRKNRCKDLLKKWVLDEPSCR